MISTLSSATLDLGFCAAIHLLLSMIPIPKGSGTCETTTAHCTLSMTLTITWGFAKTAGFKPQSRWKLSSSLCLDTWKAYLLVKE